MPIGLVPQESTSSLNLSIAKEKGIKHNNAILAATNWFAPDITPSMYPCVLRIWLAALANTGDLTIRITNGGVTLSSSVLAGTSVGALYEFDIMLYTGDTFNIRCVNAVTVFCRVVELDASAFGGAVSSASTP